MLSGERIDSTIDHGCGACALPANFQNGDVQNLKFSVMEKIHKPLVQLAIELEDVLSETERTCSRIGSSNRIHRSGWRSWSGRAQRTGRFIHNVRADEFGTTSADEDVVQEAEELKHVLAPILPSKAEVESHNVSHLPFRNWCSAVSVAEVFHLVIAKSTRKRRRQNRYRLSLDYGFFGRAHDTLPVLIVRDRKSKGIWNHPVPSKSLTHP